MAATIIDSRIFGDIFSDARMRQVWSDENRTAKYLDIERALAKVQGELGLIPQEAADEIDHVPGRLASQAQRQGADDAFVIRVGRENQGFGGAFRHGGMGRRRDATQRMG